MNDDLTHGEQRAIEAVDRAALSFGQAVSQARAAGLQVDLVFGPDGITCDVRRVVVKPKGKIFPSVTP